MDIDAEQILELDPDKFYWVKIAPGADTETLVAALRQNKIKAIITPNSVDINTIGELFDAMAPDYAQSILKTLRSKINFDPTKHEQTK